MRARPSRTPLPHEWEQVVHDLPSLRVADRLVGLRLGLRRTPDGAWRGRLTFLVPGETDRETAEIFCADGEADLWAAVRALGEHHLRALYLSLE